jgi:anaerobic magnesium-protoporphyrin IX monomethyl ester cyclase
MVPKNKPKIILYYPKPFPSRRPYVKAPLSLIAISSFLAKEDFEIIIVSENLYDQPVKKILQEIPTALCLGITAMTGHQILDGLRVARLVREIYPNLPIIWGGWHPTLEPDGTIRSPYVDIVVRGQGERTFTELIYALIKKEALDNILGISYKKDNEIIHNMDRPLEDINNFPPYPYHLIEVEKVLFDNEYGSRVLNYVSSFGCPWDCSFCAEKKAHKRRWMALDPYRMVEEIEKLIRDNNIDALTFDDSEFFISKNRVRIFCEEILKKGLNIKWANANGRIPQLLHWEEDLWELIVRSGCKGILVGAESGYQRSLDLMNKHMLVEETLAFGEKAKKYNIRIFYSMLCGLPWNMDYKKTQRLTDLEIKHTLNLADKLININPRNRIMLFLYTPYSGSTLFQRSLEIGLKVPQSLAEWGNWVLNYKTTPWIKRQQRVKVDMITNYIFSILDADSCEWVSARLSNPVARFIFRKLFKLFEVIVKFRWKHRFFAMPLDYWIFCLGRELLAIA